ncbi:MAG: hypothetical protein OEZ22_11110 [Spirochaetia bacterium]|nr:hypothetical protein [Spirochaetia bacterium]
MNQLQREFEAEKELIEQTLSFLEKAIGIKKKSKIELAAIGTFIHNIFNGIENIFKRILKNKNISLPNSETFHKDLIELVEKENIISFSLAEKLDEYRAFRHFFIHGYGIILKDEQLMPLAKNLSGIWRQFELEIRTYIQQK